MLFNYYSLTFTYSKQGEVNLYLCICLVKKARALVKVVGPLVASEEYKVYNTPMLATLEELCANDTIAGHPATVVAVADDTAPSTRHPVPRRAHPCQCHQLGPTRGQGQGTPTQYAESTDLCRVNHNHLQLFVGEMCEIVRKCKMKLCPV